MSLAAVLAMATCMLRSVFLLLLTTRWVSDVYVPVIRVPNLLGLGLMLDVLDVSSSIALPADTYLLMLTWPNERLIVVPSVVRSRLVLMVVLAATMYSTAVSRGVTTFDFPITLLT